MSKPIHKIGPKPASPRIKNMIRNLIALLIDNDDRTVYLIDQFNRDTLPVDMQDVEGHVLDAVYACIGDGISPTRANVITRLDINGRIVDPIELVDAILSESTDDGFGIRELSSFISMWTQEQIGIVSTETILDIMNDPSVDYEVKYDKAMGILANAAPRGSYGESYTEEQLFDNFLDSQRELHELVKSGKDIGPQLPFEAQKAFFSRFAWGEFTTIMGRSGWGKSLLTSTIAEHISWKQKLKCDFVLFLLEISPDTYMRRNFSRHSLIPYLFLDSGGIDLDSEKWQSKVSDYRKKLNRSSLEYGHIHTHYFPEQPRLDQITGAMERYARIAEATGRKICFGIDHMHEIDWNIRPGINETQGYQLIVSRIAGMNRRLKSHTFLIAQQGDKGEVYGSAMTRKKSQLTFEIVREEPEGGAAKDLPLYANKERTEIAKDALGNDRFLHRKGDKLTGIAKLSIVKGNNAFAGEIDLFWEGAMGIIKQNPNQIEKLRKEKRLP